jgi:hypothetical protein
MEARVAVLRGGCMRVTVEGDTVMSSDDTLMVMRHHLRLPDTVDPRGAEEKVIMAAVARLITLRRLAKALGVPVAELVK